MAKKQQPEDGGPAVEATTPPEESVAADADAPVADAPPAEPTDASPAEPTDAYLADEVHEKNVPDTLEWIGDDLERADLALAYENGRDNPRTGVLNRIERMQASTIHHAVDMATTTCHHRRTEDTLATVATDHVTCPECLRELGLLPPLDTD